MNDLVGTKWSVTYIGTRYVMEFTSNKDVRMYEADENYNYENYLHEDVYSRNGNKLVFTNGNMYISDIGFSISYFYHAKSAVIDGSKMVVTASGEKMTANIKTGDLSIEDYKGTTFTMMKVSK